jgi:hypothetical protein
VNIIRGQPAYDIRGWPGPWCHSPMQDAACGVSTRAGMPGLCALSRDTPPAEEGAPLVYTHAPATQRCVTPCPACCRERRPSQRRPLEVSEGDFLPASPGS